MKQLLIIFVILLASCTKKWTCDIHTVAESEHYNSNTTKTVIFRGTKEQKEDYEKEGTNTTSLYPEGTITQTTECY